LVDRKAPGQPSRLNETHRAALEERLRIELSDALCSPPAQPFQYDADLLFS
jgi:hypothetical protein